VYLKVIILKEKYKKIFKRSALERMERKISKINLGKRS